MSLDIIELIETLPAQIAYKEESILDLVLEINKLELEVEATESALRIKYALSTLKETVIKAKIFLEVQDKKYLILEKKRRLESEKVLCKKYIREYESAVELSHYKMAEMKNLN